MTRPLAVLAALLLPSVAFTQPLRIPLLVFDVPPEQLVELVELVGRRPPTLP